MLRVKKYVRLVTKMDTFSTVFISKLRWSLTYNYIYIKSVVVISKVLRINSTHFSSNTVIPKQIELSHFSLLHNKSYQKPIIGIEIE